MSESAPQSRQYYLGISGEQVGPLSEASLLERIRRGNVPPDSLIWYEGIGDWAPISTIAEFRDALSQGEEPTREHVLKKPSVASTLGAPTESRDEDEGVPYTFSDGDSAGEPVFSPGESNLGDSLFSKHLGMLVKLGAGVVASVLAASFYFWINSGVAPEAQIPEAKPLTPVEERQKELREHLSELYTKAAEKVPLIVAIIEKDPNDAAGLEGVQAIVDYYRQIQKHKAAADLLIKAKRPAEAASYYLADPPQYRDAEAAFYLAYQLDKTEKRREFLTKSIDLLLGPLADVATATNRIQEMEKVFPNESHPYGYYLKSVDNRIDDIFSRISFYYVQRLMNYLSTELPQINLMERPKVEVRKDKDNNYRIVGLYKGDVALNKDRLSGIHFVFWLLGDRWMIVETNITPERQKFAKQERQNAVKQSVSAAVLLSQIETVFKTQFPKNALHENIATLQPTPIDPFQ